MSVAGAGLPFLTFTMLKRIIRPPQRYDLEEDDFTEFIFDSGSEDDMDEADPGKHNTSSQCWTNVGPASSGPTSGRCVIVC